MSAILNVLTGDTSISLHLPAPIAVGSCFVLAASFVGSLYIWTAWPFTLLQKTLLENGQSAPSAYQRDHPVIIKRRSASLLCVCFLSPIFLALLAAKPEDDAGIEAGNAAAAGLWRLIGVRWVGLLQAIVLPFLLTHILFLGSHLLNHLEGMNYVYSEPHYWWLCFRNAIWVRNQIVAPATEEFVFRGCMVPLLAPILGSGLTIIVAPLFFGFAHFHHIHEKLMTTRLTLAQILPSSCFQFLYTSLYGAYSVFLFLRTGHVIAPIVAHSVCNHMGFPNFGDIFLYRKRTQALLWAAFVSGLTAWGYLLLPLTEPALFSN